MNGATGTGPGQEYHHDPHSSVLAVPAAPADFAVPSSPVAGTPSPPRVFSEATTVARAQDGDTDAFEQLVRSYEADLLRLGFRMLSDRGEAQDAVQDTFVLAWRRLPSLLDPEAFRAWIYQLMTRRCLNILRVRLRRHTGVSSGPDLELDARAGRPVAAGSTTDPAAAAQTNAMQDCLTAVLATHELTYPAIAYAIGVPVSTVRGRIARARLQLAKGMTTWR